MIDIALGLAQAATRQNMMQLLVWLGLFALILAVLGVALTVIRKIYAQGGQSQAPTSFALHDLRQMHAAGELTDEQFERAKHRVIGMSRAAAGGEGDADSAKPAQHTEGSAADDPDARGADSAPMTQTDDPASPAEEGESPPESTGPPDDSGDDATPPDETRNG
jgi:hypothetical protein